MKKVCFLQVAPSSPNEAHRKMACDNSDVCDFYFVTHDNNHADALQFCPNTNWAETRNVLADKVPKHYEYYAFVDYDYDLVSLTELSFVNQLIKDLHVLNPAVLIPYPGTGLSTHLSSDINWRSSREYSVSHFSHCGMKVIHRSLLRWFFPMVTQFDGGWSASHFFNLQELPFQDSIIMSHNILYNHTHQGGTSDENSRLNMDRMWMWIRPFFNKRFLLGNTPNVMPTKIEEHVTTTDAMRVKEVFFPNRSQLSPKINNFKVDFFKWDIIEEFFDLNHVHFRKRFKGLNKDNDILIVIGNGPSLKQSYLDVIAEKNIDAFGMNAAYRFYSDWYPKYFICYDYALCESHKENWSHMILDESIPIEKYFFIERPSVESNLGHTDPFFSDEIIRHKKFVGAPHNQDGIGYPKYGMKDKKMSCTGVNAVRYGITMGYENILMIGHDCSYVQPDVLDFSAKVTPWREKMNKTPDSNPNYFWDDYQRSGDLFHKPSDPLPVWVRLKECVDDYAKDVNVVNCSQGSRANFFKMADFDEEIRKYI